MRRRVLGAVLALAVLTLVTSFNVTSGTVVAEANSPLSITSNPLSGALVGQPYSTTLTATGGNPPYTWRLARSSPKLPKGLKLNKSTGTVSGTPTKRATTSTFTVEVLDTKVGNAARNSATATFTVTTGVTATAIAAGSAHTCAILTGGTVDCWGYNSQGQLGNGTTTDSSIPVAVSGLGGVTAIAAGDQYTCALLAGGTVDCWGYNGQGELGNGTTANSLTPVAVSGLGGVTAIAADYQHTCALHIGGYVECWGYNGFGELGNGFTTDSSIPVVVRRARCPRRPSQLGGCTPAPSPPTGPSTAGVTTARASSATGTTQTPPSRWQKACSAGRPPSPRGSCTPVPSSPITAVLPCAGVITHLASSGTALVIPPRLRYM